jgi:tape measure domain-containing protein
VAESLGAAVLTVSVDDAQLKAGLQAAERQAQSSGKKIEQALAPSGKPTQTAANGLEYYIDAQGRARDVSGRFLSIAQRQAAGLDRLGSSASTAASGVARLAPVVSGLNATLRSLAGVAGVVGLGALTQQLIATGQESQRAQIQLSALAGGYNEAAAAGQAAARIQKVLGISAVNATQGFAQLYAALRGTGIGLQQLEVLFVGISNAARLSGAGTQEAQAALLQLKQGLAAGVLQGDELRSVLEQLPAFAQAIAAQLNVNVGQLRKLGSEGKITSDIVFNAAKQLATATVPGRTEIEQIGIAFENVKAQAATALGPPLLGVLQATAAGLVAFKKFLEENEQALIGLGRSVIEIGRTLAPFVAGILAVQAAMKAWSIASKAVATAQAAVLALQGPKGWAILAGAIAASAGAAVALEKTLQGVGAATKEAKAEAQAAFAQFKQLLDNTSLSPSGAADPTKVATIQRQNAELGIGLEAIQRQIDAENQLARVAEGPYKEFLKQKLGIEQTVSAAEDKVRSLGAQLEELRGKGVSVQSPEYQKVLGDQVLAQKEVELARVQGNSALTDAGNAYRQSVEDASKRQEEAAQQASQEADSARDAYEAAAKALRSAYEGSFDLLTSDKQRSLLQEANQDLRKATLAGIFDPTKVGKLKGSSEILSAASQARGIFDAQDRVDEAYSKLTSALDKLANKDWLVSVDTSTGTATGDVVREGVYQ